MEDNLTSDEKTHFFYILLHTLQYIITLKTDFIHYTPKLLKFLKGVNMKISIDSELPISKGIGSSASYSVVIAASLLVKIIL